MSQPAFFQIIYCVWCVFWAYANYKGIEKANVTILHGANGFIHLALIVFAGVTFGWMVSLVMLFEGRLFFDVALNLFRGKAIDYVSPAPKSIIDRIEKVAFGNNGWLPKIIYIICIAIIQAVIYYGLVVILIHILWIQTYFLPTA